jgi:hypothetical protein
LDGSASFVYQDAMRLPIFTACTLTSVVLSAGAANLLENGSFELPPVTGRTSATGGGNPAVGAEPTSFASVTTKTGDDGGTLQAGLTNEVARTGKQSLYVDFQNVTAAGVRAVLTTKTIPVKADQAYRLAMWVRIDRKRPLALDESRPQMWIEVRFLKEDQTTEIGEPVAGAQSIPGDVVPGGPHQLRFTSEKWKESSAEVKTPADTKFVKISWYWITTEEEGDTDGVIYFDDASLEEMVAVPAAGDAKPAEGASTPAVNPTPAPVAPGGGAPAP